MTCAALNANLQVKERFARMNFDRLAGPHGFGSVCLEKLAPCTLATLSELHRDALLAALDEHAFLLLRTQAPLAAADLASFTKALFGADGHVDFGGSSADAQNQGAGGRRCHAPGVPEVRVLGNVTVGGEAAALLCRIGCVVQK